MEAAAPQQQEEEGKVVVVPKADLNNGHGAFRLSDGRLAYLASAKGERFVSVNQPAARRRNSGGGQVVGAASPGGVEEFAERHGRSEALLRQLRNRVRKCEGCGKPVAFTLPCCNACGRDLSSTPISFTPNVFVGFVYGIEKGPFPLTVSMRYEDEACLVFDDLLALTPCHLNAVPATAYMPDWRLLLKDPVRALALISSLFDRSWQVVEEQFYANEAWRAKTLKGCAGRGGGKEKELVMLREHVAAGFNYPPSQYHLHLQFMLPPFLPFQYALCLQRVHFTHGRFFPFEYVRAVLELNEPLAEPEGMAIEDVVRHFKGRGVDYDEIHHRCYARYLASHCALANWQSDDFGAVGVLGGGAPEQIFALSADKCEAGAEEEGVIVVREEKKEGSSVTDPKAMQARDKLALQNYGRPYTPEGKPQGRYYAYAKPAPHAFPDF